MAKISPLMIIPPVIFAGFVALAAVGMFREDPEALPSALIGQQAPAVQLTGFPGREGFDDADLRDGKIKLVNFWASWCAPCRVEHPNLTALAAEGIAILGVNYKDKPENGTKFIADLGDPYAAIGSDAQGRMALNWGVYGVPETYVIDGEGTILMRFAGPVTQRVIDTRLRPALEAAAKAE
ncbi:DsbE family thiol:disulfide interchange protein [Antarcticimicrobium sediminis]|uniref:DsbE family thiol:disulfide interchange protein n=1 Tax=Antarcticimicrobium sediminis TaxID=2546227 RepID=A0A4R5EYY9_9RHOB|nr:DsbE family thiol:disulfide interchange protein [Antarcticimicrobium sediminis]TDE40253.1 DsbE family thiol:disulfide interchange protein [Antarcticimicrobium sediminis]